jgi:hypothetical protein
MKKMTIDQITVKLIEIRDLGFVPTMRSGNTGIGYTLETLFGIKENNVRTPDFGEIELKSQRKNMSTPITLFTFNRGAWRVKQSDVIRTFGYVDENGRQALYCFATSKPNPQGLFTLADELELKLFHTSGVLIASWAIEVILERFSEKMNALVTVLAETRLNETLREEFWFNEAYFLHTPSRENFVALLRQDAIVLDVRMHLKESGVARNHGTAFRTSESVLPLFFTHKERLI